jgi:hypothetical protein
MKTMNKILASSVAAILVGIAAPASAKLTDAEIARLGADLTPVGAEKAGNKDGTIPAWDGGLCSAPSGWNASQGYTDPFASDKVLFTITKANAAQYKDKLTPGTLAMLDKYDNFKMNVYQTRRTACYPQEVYDNVKAQAGKVELQGFGIANRGPSTVPFPIPKSGMEAIWNHTMRYLGGGISRDYNSFPVRANGDYYKIGVHEFRIFNQNMDPPQDNLLLGFLSYFLSPATLEGTVFLVHEPVDQVKQSRSAWIYNAGQRRVRRAPDLAYDNVNDGTEGLRTTDQFDAYNGAPDRYDWKIVGKKEVYVPYNSYKLGSKSLKYKDMIQKNTPNSDLLRYELHRVWEIEANLKAGSKHVYGKRVFFLDEDTWSVLYEDAYDTRKQLWRVSMFPLIQFYDAKVPWYRANIWHDLSNSSYLFSNIDNEIKTPWKFGEKGKWGDFQPDSLRRIGTK